MSTPSFLSIADTRAFIKEHPEVYRDLKIVMEHSISEKKTTFRKEKFPHEYDRLKQFHLIGSEQDDVFLLDNTSLVLGYVLTEIAERRMKEKVPNEPLACLQFVDRFSEEIRKPNVRTTWYGSLAIQFESYLLIQLHQEYQVDVTGFVDEITENMKEQMPWLRSLDLTYKHTFSYLFDSVGRMYDTIVKMLGEARTQDAALEALRDVGKINPQKAEALYLFSKERDAANYDGFLPNLLIGLYHLNEAQYLDEAIKLFPSKPVQGLLALIWFDYDDPNQIRKAYDFLIRQGNQELEYLRNAFIFYVRLIDNQHTPADIVNSCFGQIREYSKYTDDHLRRNLVWRTGMIKGYDQEKYDLLPDFMAWGDPHIVKDYFNHFSSPAYLFDLIRQTFLHHGMRASIEVFQDPLQYQHTLNPAAFEKELAGLLSDDRAIVRFGGMQVLTSRHYGAYPLNLVEMDEKTQIRIIETLLPTPINIEEILPLMLQLRNSAFEAARKALEAGLKDLIRAYEHHLVDMVKNLTDPAKPVDKLLLDALDDAYAAYKQEQEVKMNINEFDPYANEYKYLEMYYRLEKEKQAESMEEAQGKSFFAQIANRKMIIRGSGYETELGEVALLQEFGVSRLVDRRLYSNPEKFEWTFRMNAMAKNYTINPES